MTEQQASSVDPLFEAGFRAFSAGRLAEAEDLFRRHLARAPRSAPGWTNLGSIYRSTGRIEAAIAANRRAVWLAPASLAALNNLSNSLHSGRRYAEALGMRERLLKVEPRSPSRVRDLAATLRALTRNEEAIALVDRAEAAGVIDGECRVHRGLARLMLGDFAKGFADNENRLGSDEVPLPAHLPGKPWTGEPLEGKRIIVMPEQGMGDAIAIARFLPRLKALGAHVTLGVRRPLLRLFSRLEGVDVLADHVRKDEPFDYHLMMMSLPHRTGFGAAGPEPLPPPTRLALPEESRARAAERLAPFDGLLKVGIVWTGSLTNKINAVRAVGPERFLGLAAMPGVQLFSLYKGDGHADFVASGAAGPIQDACGDDRDLADGAAMARAMDLLIVTDTGIVHAAASLGSEVWLMAAHESFWFWGLGERARWYPTVRLFRQPTTGDWDTPFAAAEAALAARVAERRA